MCFLLALFRVKLGDVDLVVLGFLFLALHSVWRVEVVPARFRRE